MKNVNLPLIPSGATSLGDAFSIFVDDKFVTWYHQLAVINRHPLDDTNTYRYMLGFMHFHNGVPQAVLARATGFHANSVMKYANIYRESGLRGFFSPVRVRGASVLVPEVLSHCQELLDQGLSRTEVAERVGIKKNTLDKAIRDKRLQERRNAPGVTRSDRARADRSAASSMGSACTEISGRVLASLGRLSGVTTSFQTALDVNYGGVLCAIPALVGNGLFDFLHMLPSLAHKSYYYTIIHVVNLLANMSLLRMQTIEMVRGEAPGEMGKLCGLDRIPEVRCLRQRLALLGSDEQAVSDWSQAMSNLWMRQHPELTGTLYVDGHVRAYYGDSTELPRRFFSRFRLCLRGVTDYWVSDRLGSPFFYVERQINEGLISVLRNELVPRLLACVPGQPSDDELAANPYLRRFMMVFDREGYSPAFFFEMWVEYRIACMTYRKYVTDRWPVEEFAEVTVKLANGDEVAMMLAARTVKLKCEYHGEKTTFEAKEFRRLRQGKNGGHQTSIITTDMTLTVQDGPPEMFARWCQENYFRYASKEYALDLLAGHQTQSFPCGSEVVTQAWRDLENQRRRQQGKLNQANIKYAGLDIKIEDMDKSKIEKLLFEKAECMNEIESLKNGLEEIKAKKRQTPHKLPFDQLPEEEKFERLEPTRKMVLDTIRMTAYRAETAMAAIVKKSLASPETARSVVKALLFTPADIKPDTIQGNLNVILHPLGEERLNTAARELISTLNETETVFPGTNLTLKYFLTGDE